MKIDEFLLLTLVGLLSTFILLIFINKIKKSYLPKEELISWFLFFLWLFVNTFIFDYRNDRKSLLTEGLSSQNMLQIFVFVIAFLWSLHLIFSKKVNLSQLRSANFYWLILLIFVFGLSTFWSVWAIFTFYRFFDFIMLKPKFYKQKN
jgi:hypothetical protein